MTVSLAAEGFAERSADRAEIDRLWKELIDASWQCGDRRQLSPGEAIVLRMAAGGATNKEIGYELKVSPSTVATLLRRALQKLKVSSRGRLWMVHAFLGGPAAPVTTAHRLTPAEHEVAWHAASGRSNAEIAELRTSSVRTIANQLASAFRKLGVACRGELAAALVSAPRTDGQDRRRACRPRTDVRIP